MRKKGHAKDYLTTTEAAIELGLSNSTVLRAAAAGEIKSVRTPGGHFRIRRQDLESIREHRNRVQILENAIRWALGELGEFPQRKPGYPAYWWRKELRRRAQIEYKPKGDSHE